MYIFFIQAISGSVGTGSDLEGRSLEGGIPVLRGGVPWVASLRTSWLEVP